MRIGIDATCWANERGYGRFTRELVTAMVAEHRQHEFTCFLDPISASTFGLRGPHVNSVIVERSTAPAMGATKRRRRSVRDWFRFAAAVRRENLDVFFWPSMVGYFPLPPGLPMVVTVHDAIAEKSAIPVTPAGKDRLAWRAKMKLALMQSKLVLAVSPHAARDAARHLGVPASKLRVTGAGVSSTYLPSESEADIQAAATRARLPAGARWLMYVGGFGPHKHVEVIVRAHAKAAKRLRPATEPALFLVLVGHCSEGLHPEVSRIREVVKECGTEHLVRWVGFLPDSEVRHLHSGAMALVLVSASEGFGLAAVEAARCGTPVIATTESPLPDLLEGGGIFVPPGDVDALTAAIRRLLDNDADRMCMGSRAQDRARALSWSEAGRVTLAALEEVASAAEKRGLSQHARN